MRAYRVLASVLTTLAALLEPPIAAACGGCFTSPSVDSQVSDHRMILSIGKEQTTLYDQIVYRGSPESFAWVLPVIGDVEIGVSAPAMFIGLDELTAPVVLQPASRCRPTCGTTKVSFTAGGSGGNFVGSGAIVLGERVVGPYEVVRLRAREPYALESWLTSHGFVIPEDLAGVVATYVSEGYDFVCIKLVPGLDVTAMRPVRLTMAGAATTLPL